MILIGYVAFLVAMWRGMRAHESIAETLREGLQELRGKLRA
jgi:hypothetical protein